MSALNVVAEREERVAAERNAVAGGEERLCLFIGERSGLNLEIFLPDAFCADILFIFIDVTVNNIVSVGALDIVSERQVENFLVLTEEPGVRLCAGESCAVNSRLLTCSDADCLTVNSIANGV